MIDRERLEALKETLADLKGRRESMFSLGVNQVSKLGKQIFALEGAIVDLKDKMTKGE